MRGRLYIQKDEEMVCGESREPDRQGRATIAPGSVVVEKADPRFPVSSQRSSVFLRGLPGGCEAAG